MKAMRTKRISPKENKENPATVDFRSAVMLIFVTYITKLSAMKNLYSFFLPRLICFAFVRFICQFYPIVTKQECHSCNESAEWRCGCRMQPRSVIFKF